MAPDDVEALGRGHQALGRGNLEVALAGRYGGPGEESERMRSRPWLRRARTGAALALLLLALAAWGHQASGAGGAGAPPDDPLFRYQWHLRAIQIPEAWRVSRGRGAVVAVLDTGVAYENRGRYRRAPDLAGTRFVPGWDFVDDDAHPNDEPPAQRQSHGTHIAGIIAQTTDNAIGAAGVAPRASIMPVRVLDRDVTGTARAVARGLRFAADHGADVVNLSIAGNDDVALVRRAVAYAVSRGVTVVASAGNAGRARVSYPAAYPSVIAVGAVRRDRRRAGFSSYGRALDLVAPVGERQILDSDGSETGDGVVQQTLKGGRASFCYCWAASTSVAAAEVSGVAALLVASGRASTPARVRAALTEGARDLGPRGRDSEYGAGLLQAAGALERVVPPRPASAEEGGSGGLLRWLAGGLAVAVALALGVVARRRRA